MKAIQVKYLAPTSTLGSRLKAWVSERNYIIEQVDYGMEMEEQAKLLVEKLIKKLNWVTCMVKGFGSLPCGDWVAVLGEAVMDFEEAA